LTEPAGCDREPMLKKNLWRWNKVKVSGEAFNPEMILQDNNRMELQSVGLCWHADLKEPVEGPSILVTSHWFCMLDLHMHEFVTANHYR
jgi:hypothetical protein